MSKIFQLDFGTGCFFHLTIPKVFPRPLTDIYKCLGGFLHLKPTAGCQISTSILGVGSIDISDNMKQPAAILVLQYWYTILVIPVFYQYLPVSANTGTDTGRY